MCLLWTKIKFNYSAKIVKCRVNSSGTIEQMPIKFIELSPHLLFHFYLTVFFLCIFFFTRLEIVLHTSIKSMYMWPSNTINLAYITNINQMVIKLLWKVTDQARYLYIHTHKKTLLVTFHIYYGEMSNQNQFSTSHNILLITTITNCSDLVILLGRKILNITNWLCMKCRQKSFLWV